MMKIYIAAFLLLVVQSVQAITFDDWVSGYGLTGARISARKQLPVWVKEFLPY